jgi:hypothetical protein
LAAPASAAARWAKSRKGLIVHHDRFAREDVVERHRLPVLDLETVIAEVLCTRRPWRALACLDQALTGLGDQQARALIAKIDLRLAARDDRRGNRVARIVALPRIRQSRVTMTAACPPEDGSSSEPARTRARPRTVFSGRSKTLSEDGLRSALDRSGPHGVAGYLVSRFPFLS